MKAGKPSPNLIAGIAFLAVILAAIFFIAATLLFAPFLPVSPTVMADTVSAVSSAACPGAVVVSVLAFLWARSKQRS